MTLVSPTQSNPGDTIEAADINDPVNQIAAVVNGNIDSTNISSVSGSKLQAGTVAASALDTNANVETRTSESDGNFVASGAVWSIISGLNGTMTSGVVYITGKRVVVSSIASKTYTAGKDTYVSVDINGSVSYSEVANGAAAPSLPASSVWLAIVITSGAAITAVNLWGNGAAGTPVYPDNRLGAWRSWTPTFTNLAGGSLSFARYTQLGKTVHFKLYYTLAGAGVSGAVTFTLPVAMVSGLDPTHPIGVVGITDAGTAVYQGNLLAASTTTAGIRVSNASATYTTLTQLSSTIPFTWGASDFITVSGTYEAA